MPLPPILGKTPRSVSSWMPSTYSRCQTRILVSRAELWAMLRYGTPPSPPHSTPYSWGGPDREAEDCVSSRLFRSVSRNVNDFFAVRSSDTELRFDGRLQVTLTRPSVEWLLSQSFTDETGNVCRLDL